MEAILIQRWAFGLIAIHCRIRRPASVDCLRPSEAGGFYDSSELQVALRYSVATRLRAVERLATREQFYELAFWDIGDAFVVRADARWIKFLLCEA